MGEAMNLDVLLSAMYLEDYHYIDSLNIKGNCVIVNQCDRTRQRLVLDKGRSIQYIETTERGLSKSRNMAIDNSVADICMLCDNDVEFMEGYEHEIIQEYEKHPDYDVIAFHVESDGIHPSPVFKSERRLNCISCLKICSVEISFRRTSVQKVHFNELIGAGTTFKMGEENAFLTECIRSGLAVYYIPAKIARLRHEPSTWNTIFDKEYMISRGASYAAISSVYWIPLNIQFAIRKYSSYKRNLTFIQAIYFLFEGSKEYFIQNKRK